MKRLIKDFLNTCARFFADKTRRSLFLLGILSFAACADFFISGLVRRTFVFYSVNTENMTVEDRMLRRSPSREQSVTRYIEETLLGPVSPDVLPLFPGGTSLRSLLLREGVVYADFSEEAALPPVEGGKVLTNLQTLNAGIRRNFSFVKDARFFIMGKAAYFDDFQRDFDGGGEKQAVSP